MLPRLERFKAAQDRPQPGFASALADIETWRKRGHWIWYVFPQLSGLGSSSVSQTYGIADLAEAEASLRDPMLRSPLLAMTITVAERVSGGNGVALKTLMGSSIDVLTLVSSLTLFGQVARTLDAPEGSDGLASFARVAEEVLGVAASQGYPPCQYTLARPGEMRSA